jgi:hypothetical protein
MNQQDRDLCRREAQLEKEQQEQELLETRKHYKTLIRWQNQERERRRNSSQSYELVEQVAENLAQAEAQDPSSVSRPFWPFWPWHEDHREVERPAETAEQFCQKLRNNSEDVSAAAERQTRTIKVTFCQNIRRFLKYFMCCF